MTGNNYPHLMANIKAGIGGWTEAVFGTPFTSKGRAYTVGAQMDASSCGVCVINAINASIHRTELFKAQARSKFRLRYFIEGVEYLLQGQVCAPPAGHSPAYSSFPRTRLNWMERCQPPLTLRHCVPCCQCRWLFLGRRRRRPGHRSPDQRRRTPHAWCRVWQTP